MLLYRVETLEECRDYNLSLSCGIYFNDSFLAPTATMTASDCNSPDARHGPGVY